MKSRLQNFYIKGGQRYRPLNVTIPGDFSSATFFAVQAAISERVRAGQPGYDGSPRRQDGVFHT